MNFFNKHFTDLLVLEQSGLVFLVMVLQIYFRRVKKKVLFDRGQMAFVLAVLVAMLASIAVKNLLGA